MTWPAAASSAGEREQGPEPHSAPAFAGPAPALRLRLAALEAWAADTTAPIAWLQPCVPADQPEQPLRTQKETPRCVEVRPARRLDSQPRPSREHLSPVSTSDQHISNAKYRG